MISEVKERGRLSSTDTITPLAGFRLSLLAQLHCPYCGSDFELTSARVEADTVDYGVLQCACYQYPIVEGIPILQHTEGLRRVVELVRSGDHRSALLRALDAFRVKWAHQSKWHRIKYHLNCRRVVGSDSVSFDEAAQLVRRPKIFSDYLTHRYANPSFLAAIGPLMLLRELRRQFRYGVDSFSADAAHAGIRVLDLACGAGHSSFLMRLLHPDLSVISADQDFVSVYLAKRFMAPDATHVCWDVEVPSPFPDRYFEAVFCLDAFHYFKSKRALVAELKRILEPHAMWLFPHLHNALQPNPVAGLPFAPDVYLDCFGLADGRLFDEAEILHGLVKKGMLDLQTEIPLARLNQTHALTFVRGEPDLWRVHDGFASAFCRNISSLAVNPIYRGRWHQANLQLELSWPNDVLRGECAGVQTILPANYRLSRADLQNDNSSTETRDWDHLKELVSKFILVPLPRSYRQRNLMAWSQ